MLHIIAQMAGVGMFEEDWAVPVNCPAPPQGGGKPQKRERKRFTSDGPAPPQGGGKPHRRCTSDGPTPPQGGGKPHKRFTSDGPAPPQGGGKPRPYYTRAWQADSLYSRGDRKGQYHSNTKNVSKGAVLEMEALISRALVTEMGGMLEHAWIEPQTACRHQHVWVAQVSQHLLPETRLSRSRHQRSQQQRIAQHMHGMGEAETIGVQIGLGGGGGHEEAHGVVEQEQPIEFLQHPQGGATAQGVRREAQMGLDLIDTQFDLP